MTSRSDLATLLALALTARLFPPSPSLGDVRMLTHGRMHLWPGWDAQPTEARDLVATLMAHRPDELAEDNALLDRLRGLLDAGDDFEVADVAGSSPPNWSTRFRLVAGEDLDDRIARWVSKLERLRGRSNGRPSVSVDDCDSIILIGDGTSYRVPSSHVPDDGPAHLDLRTTNAPIALELDTNALRQLARRVDGAASGNSGLYERVAVEQFLEQLVDRSGLPTHVFPSGVTQLAVAPTGTGKSVFARLVALHLASEGVPVALVVPDIQSAWKEALRLEDAADAAGLDLSVVPLSSWRNIAEKLSAHLDHPFAEDDDGLWALRNVAYACHLGSYAEAGEGSPPPGREPCTRLRQPDPAQEKARPVSCPFNRQCGRFAAFERALSADIIVVNHHSFLAGRVPVQVSVDGGPPRKLSTAELLLRRCGAVFIDEIDALQDSAIGADSRGLVLSSRGKLSKANRLYVEVERRRAENRIDPGVRFERGRSALLRIMHEAERLSELINRKELDWPERGRMTWREAHDAWLANRLYGSHDGALDRLRQLFDTDAIVDDPRSERLRLALAPLGPGLGDGTLMADIRTNIMLALADWPLKGARSVSAQHLRDRVTNRIIVRAVLVQLDKALGHLRPQLPGLEQQDVQQAAELRDDLLGYAPWQPSPTGPLGRRLFGYAFTERLDAQGALETRIMSGDPHGLLREFGGLVARALCGQPRVVLGLSATCRFRGSPRADVLGALSGLVPDTARNVRVRGAPVEARISGIGASAERIEAARTAAEQLWPSTLSRYLESLQADPESRGRARALLVTGSYREAKAVAEGLRRAAGAELTIRYLVRTPEAAQADTDALPRAMLESFGGMRAPAVLVGPLSVVARGHNILQPGTPLSALAGIFVLTRPVPPSHDADRFLAHVAYNARLFPPTWQGEPGATVEAERRAAWKRLRDLQRSPATFRHMEPELRRELVCDVLADLAQLAGRARRGGTPVDLVFVDGAFQDEVVPWSGLVRDILEWWRDEGWLAEMTTLHGAFVAGLAEYAGFDLGEV